mmetsp:Transcript_4054/g.9970  ORF Transcript_4054/g.9970 Transcript_4054/m.9970 type:complete len:206 (-) Transcript_4054:3351-3968(-)
MYTMLWCTDSMDTMDPSDGMLSVLMSTTSFPSGRKVSTCTLPASVPTNRPLLLCGRMVVMRAYRTMCVYAATRRLRASMHTTCCPLPITTWSRLATITEISAGFKTLSLFHLIASKRGSLSFSVVSRNTLGLMASNFSLRCCRSSADSPALNRRVIFNRLNSNTRPEMGQNIQIWSLDIVTDETVSFTALQHDTTVISVFWTTHT